MQFLYRMIFPIPAIHYRVSGMKSTTATLAAQSTLLLQLMACNAAIKSITEFYLIFVKFEPCER